MYMFYKSYIVNLLTVTEFHNFDERWKGESIKMTDTTFLIFTKFYDES